MPHLATRLRSLLPDVPASMVTFLVAVPLSMGIALASGAPIMAGLISAAIGGILVGLLSGAPLQVSGAAAGLAVIVFGDVQRFGFAGTCAIVLVAGLVQILLGAGRIARVTLAISPAVIHGMLAGIGVQITLSQLHIVLGGSPQSSALRNLRELPGQIAGLHGAATVLGLVTIALLLLWPLVPWKRLRVLPAALVAVAGGTALSLAFGVDMPRVTLPDDWRSAFSLPAWPREDLGAFALAVVSLAVVASAESLLSAVATDKMHSGKRADLDRELVAQGIGNTVAGLIGGLPVTGVIVRSTANIEAGARTRLSAILHGLWVVVFVTQLHGVLTRIPLSVLAALLVVVGVKLVNIGHIRQLVKAREAPVYFVTLGGVVFINLLAGIAIGVSLAIFLLLRRRTRMTVRVERGRGHGHGSDEVVWHVAITGALTFLGVPRLAAALGTIPRGAVVDVDLDVDLMDHAAFEAIHDWRTNHEKGGGRVDIDQLHEAWRTVGPTAPVPSGNNAVAATAGGAATGTQALGPLGEPEAARPAG